MLDVFLIQRRRDKMVDIYKRIFMNEDTSIPLDFHWNFPQCSIWQLISSGLENGPAGNKDELYEPTLFKMVSLIKIADNSIEEMMVY